MITSISHYKNGSMTLLQPGSDAVTAPLIRGGGGMLSKENVKTSYLDIVLHVTNRNWYLHASRALIMPTRNFGEGADSFRGNLNAYLLTCLPAP